MPPPVSASLSVNVEFLIVPTCVFAPTNIAPPTALTLPSEDKTLLPVNVTLSKLPLMPSLDKNNAPP